MLAVAAIDGDGFVTAEGTMSLGGTILEHSVEGQSQVRTNCTGTVKYTQKINGNPAPDINIRFIVLEAGKTIRGLAVDQGWVLSCKLERL